MKVVFVLAAFCLVLVSANLLVKEPDKITCTTDFSCGKFCELVLVYALIQPSTDTDKFDVRNLALSFYPDPPERGKNVTVTLTGIVSKLIVR